MSRGNPWDDPNWAPLKREATLVRQLIGSGATALGKAGYADGLGNYYMAFFGLSIGIERLAKLICVCDHAIDNRGQFPSAKLLKNTYGHDIPKLLDAVDAISSKRKLKLSYPRPHGKIEAAIVACLAAFADAKQGRYNNFDALDNGQQRSQFEPLRKWWDEVAEPILHAHYYGKSVERRVTNNVHVIDAMIGAHSMALHFDERGDLMDHVTTASTHTGKTEIVRKFGRFYSLMIVRWLAEVLDQIFDVACCNHEMDAFFGHSEFFSCYRGDDEFLKTRKIWPLR